MDWLLDQAQKASPFVAFFMIVVGGGALTIVWRQLLSERADHRKAEEGFTQAALAMAKSQEKYNAKLAGAVNRLADSVNRIKRVR